MASEDNVQVRYERYKVLTGDDARRPIEAWYLPQTLALGVG